jgi:hypothetical protein
MNVRGDVYLKAGRDKEHTFVLALTMGALAQLETEFGVRSYVDALAKFKTSADDDGNVLHPSMNDLLRLVYCLVQFETPMSLEEFRLIRLDVDEIGEAISKLFPADDSQDSPSKAPSRPSRPLGQDGSTSA